jgi:hypothetical protein
MTNNEKTELLKNKLIELLDFKAKLSVETLDDFKKLKSNISDLLDDNQKIRFNQVLFYTETQEYSKLDADDLPF